MRKSLESLLAEISASIPAENADKLRADVAYFSTIDPSTLPNFNDDGSVAFYDVAGVLLGKSALIRFIERCK